MPVVSPLSIVLNSTTGPLVDEWYGYSLYETASTAALSEVLFKDGTSTGQILWTINLGADGFNGDIFNNAVAVPSGVLHVDTTGSISGVVFI